MATYNISPSGVNQGDLVSALRDLAADVGGSNTDNNITIPGDYSAITSQSTLISTNDSRLTSGGW